MADLFGFLITVIVFGFLCLLVIAGAIIALLCVAAPVVIPVMLFIRWRNR